MDQDVNTQLADYFGFPYGLSFNELKDYENMELNQRLIAAAKMGDYRVVNKMVELEADDFDAAMAKAAKYNHEFLVDRFIELEADNFNLAMISAAKGGNEKLVDKFIKLGANNFDGAMIAAAKGGHDKLVDKFIDLGANDFTEAYYASIQGGNHNLIEKFEKKYLLNNIEETSFYFIFIAAVKSGDITLLNKYEEKFEKKYFDEGFLIAGEKGYKEVITWLSNRAPNYSRNSVFIGAAEGGHLDLVEEFIDFKNTKAIEVAYETAVEQNHEKIAEYLMEKIKVSPKKFLIEATRSGNQRLFDKSFDRWGRLDKALFAAIEKGNIKIASKILKAGVITFNAGGGENKGTAVDLAITYNRLTIFKKLVEFGYLNLNCSYECNDLNLSLQKAARYGIVRFIRLLIQLGANNLNLALQWAVKTNKLTAVKFLISQGANDFALARKPTNFRYRREENYDKMIEYLNQFA